ncbi:MAG: hypothetical protein N2712_04260 [Brevinematales bacterium]|nr:hypothetical protein [Brevinematales bacterium]
MIVVFFIIMFFTSSCNLLPEQDDLYNKDFLFDDFQSFDNSIWTARETFIGFSQLKRENVSISNGFILFSIREDSTDSSGISSIPLFPRGRFSIYALNKLTNVALEMELFSYRENSKISFKYYFDDTINTNVVETYFVSPLTNIYFTLSNTFMSDTSLLTIIVYNSSIVFLINNSEITRFSINTPNNFEVRINTYMIKYDIRSFRRNVYIDYFSYQK